jgi:hypothetical protein
MKMRFAFSLFALALLASMGIGRATETINTDVALDVDRFGDGTLKMTFHLSAIEWVRWKYQFGDHPDILWRNLKQIFAKYALDKFDLQKNDVDRTAVAEISAHALTHVRGDGTRRIEVGKESRLVSNTGREWIFNATSQQSPDAPIVNVTSRIILPAEAKNARLDQPGTESEQLVYEAPDNSGFGRVFLGLGLLSIAGGILFGILALVFLLKRQTTLPVLPAH